MTNSQIKKLGERLRKNPEDYPTDDDLKLLDEFRHTYDVIDEKVGAIIKTFIESQKDLKCFFTPRKRKTPQSIIDKLKRPPSTVLYKMQDIAGGRIVVENSSKYVNKIKEMLVQAFAQHGLDISNDDIKERNKHGYRAIHIIVRDDKKCYEIQLRTFAQDVWANLIERLCDESNSLKYGGTKKEQPRMEKLKELSERFFEIDQRSFDSFDTYREEIKKEIQNVLSN